MLRSTTPSKCVGPQAPARVPIQAAHASKLSLAPESHLPSCRCPELLRGRQICETVAQPPLESMACLPAELHMDLILSSNTAPK